MKTRREFCQTVVGSAVGSMALSMVPASAAAKTPLAAAKKRRLPLLELQQKFVDLRFGMFVHFNMATFQDREWGDPTAPVSQFDPSNLDTDQWAAAAKSARMTWGCLTTKHHDGFCLWPTATAGTSVRQMGRPVDVVRAYVDSFRKAGLRVALYYSILDLRDNIRHFNITPAKLQMVKDQLTELFTHYGEIDALIIDGWNAPWSRINYEEMPFAEIYQHIKGMQPQCLVSDLNASQFPAGGLYYCDLKAYEQNAGQKVPEQSDLPAFSCVTITDQWFWKQKDLNGHLKPVTTVVDEWLIPLNRRHCNLILNAPPTREGRLAPNVIARLEEIGRVWEQSAAYQLQPGKIREHIVITTANLATGRPIRANANPEGGGPDQANDGEFNSSWYLDDGLSEGWLEIDLLKSQSINVVALVEPVGRWKDYPESRIKSYKFERWDGARWVTLLDGGVPAPVAIDRVPRVTTSKVRLSFLASHEGPHISEIGLYDEPDY
jgi:alpha-L-fucosidase